MKFPLSLVNYENTTLEDIVDACNQIGLEVENIIDQKEALEQFEVAEITNTTIHPNDDKLRVCTVKTKSNEELQIVCGAPNARTGIKVVLAKIGTTIPNGKFKIKKSSIRGVESFGMLCSSNELNISSESNFIIELESDVQLTDKVEEIFGLDKPILELNITPNRGDCLSIVGIVRDINAYFKNHNKNQIQCIEEAITLDINNNKLPNNIIIKNEVENFCPIFYGLTISNIKNTKSPNCLTKKLHPLGIKPISAVVDILNYIMHYYGQPMHAYDADKITTQNNKIVLEIKSLEEETEFIDLNEIKHAIKTNNYIIHNNNKVICIPGVIGSESTKCSEDTKNILLESAFFSPEHIKIASQNLKITSDAAFRFARQTDPNITKKMLLNAAYMIKNYCGGEVTSFQEFTTTPTIKEISFNTNKIQKICGIEISNYAEILQSLGFKETIQNTWQIPSWRYDFDCEENLIEEIVRIYGYKQLNSIANNTFEYCPIKKSNKDKIIHNLNQAMLSAGFNEIITFPFTEKNYDNEKKIELISPINQQQAFLRNSLIESLLKVAKLNYDKGNIYGNIYEIDKAYYNNDGNYIENNILSALKFGKSPKLWNIPTTQLDFYAIKQIALSVLSKIGYNQNKIQFELTEKSDLINENTKNIYHPSASAIIKDRTEIIGIVGIINPKFLQTIQLDTNCIGMEIFLDNLQYRIPNKKQPINIIQFPEISRDFTFNCSNKDLDEIIRKISKISSMIQNISIKELYNQNMTLSVTIQAKDKTLESDEINNISDKIAKYLEIID